jgi:predicted CxxxxCH...CXXCH cytochrome family protein
LAVVMLVVASCSEERSISEPCVDCDARVHPTGILDPASDDFHGKELARRNWDFALCASCHGASFDGGKAKVACTTCHAEGPTACVTCHRDGPTSGSHAQHAASQTACGECHVVPARWDAPGHIVDDSPPAEVTFGARANLTPVAGDRRGPPAFAAGACTNVYCHGDVLHAGGGASTKPQWATPAPTGTCTQCHAAPPPSHAQSDCATCHPASAPHIDGTVQIGTTAGCDGCHGDATSPAPGRDLAGNTSFTAIGVGAHRAHLDAPSGLRGPIACATCHVVPATLTAIGHLDSELPAEVESSLGWERSTQTCTTTACHGEARPAWTTRGEVACGTCHGIPPASASHAPNMPLSSCASCHPATVTATGAIIIDNGSSTHMNGVVDAL